MSKKMPYYSLDKVSATISIDAKARVKWDNRARSAGKKVTTFIAEFLEQAVREDPFTVEDVKRQAEYLQNNINNREKRKARKV